MNLGMENEKMEFKKSTSELKEGVESVASILNKHGSGTLYFGVKPNGDVCGQAVAESTLRQVSQAIGSSIEPRITPEIKLLSDDEGCSYIQVSFQGTEAPYACKGTYRIRSADEDIVMTAAQIEAAMVVRIEAKDPWDGRISGRSISDVHEETLRAYVNRGNAKGRIPFEFVTTEDTLSRLDLLCNCKLTNAADVLFCPSKVIRLKMGILATHSRTEILDLHQEEGTVFDLVNKAAVYILNNTRRRFVINDNGPRDEIPELPSKAVKEALMNAFAHRDWASVGCVQIDIFNDAVEILSPGWFIEGQSPEEHLAGTSTSSKTRNALITKTLYRSGDIESYGTGIPRIKELCAEVGVEIEYIKTSDGTKLIFHRNDAFAGDLPQSAAIRRNPPQSAAIRRNPPQSADIDALVDGLGKNDQLVFACLQRQDILSSAEIAAEIEIPVRTVRDALRRLVDADLVVATGQGKNRTYSLAKR